MGDSDTENEAFVQNVMHELSAFDVEDKGKLTSSPEQSEKVDKVDEKAPPDKPSTTAEPSGDNSPKQPSRIIRLSRPANPFTSRSLPSAPASSSSNAGPQSTTTATVSLRTTPSPAPGSRLAALNRPGSPMHKILQRAQSPALAAAARMSRPTSDSQPAETTKTVKLPSENGNANENSVDSTGADTGSVSENRNSESTENSSSRQTRSILPPRIHSSGSASSSILLRRPQSPLHSGKSQLLIHKQISVDTNSQSPNSPLSTTSPKSPHLDNQSPGGPSSGASESEKAAIRNKLRANSFRLKDLLTQRPFTKRRDGNDTTSSKDDTVTDQAEANVEQESKGLVDSKSGAETETKSGVGSRSRWRTEASSLSITGTRSRITERTSSLISARSFRTRALNSEHQSFEKSSDNSSTRENNVNKDLSQSEKYAADSSTQQIDSASASLPDSVKNSSASEPIVSVGATLLRSPRTRIISNKSNVPFNSKEQSGSHSELPQATETKNINSNANCNSFNPQDLTETDSEDNKRVRAISDLEKESEANLIFDSENIGQQETGLESQSNNHIISDAKTMSQSIHTCSMAEIVEPAMQNPGSVPTTPVSSMSAMRTSKSYDNTVDPDFANPSSALKRSFAVTDLDKAMRDRDQQKLNLIFKDENKTSGDVPEMKTPDDTNEADKETDIDARHIPRSTRSPLRHRKMAWSMDDKPTTPTSPPGPPPVGAVAPMVYKPSVNLEDAVKWPIDIPGKLDFRKMEVFEGQMLLNWLTGSIDKSHYLRLVMTKHDLSVIACQICTCLLAAGVVKQLESKDQDSVFKSDCMYYWTHTETNKQVVTQDVNKLTPMWPPTQDESPEKPGLKYTEADHQAAMVTLRHEYKQEVDKMQSEQQGVLDRARHEYETRLQQAVERISQLQQEVEKYKNLAGLEQLSQKALSEANAARLEAGLPDDSYGYANGFHTPMTDTPSVSQYHTPSMTPEGLPAGMVLNNGVRPAVDMLEEGSVTSEQSQDNPEGEGSEVESVPVPPPPPPPPPGSVPEPPPLPGSALNRRVSLKPVVNPKSPMKPLFWQRIQVHEVKTPKNKELLDKRLVWEEIEEGKIDMTELDELFSKTSSEHSKKLSFNKPKSKSKQVAKVIAAKRSQVVGILLSSLRIDMSEIEHAILSFDTSLISEEKLRQIYECRCDDDELKKLKDHVRKHPDVPLDKPDQFLYDLSLIPDYAERIFCFIFREAFQESISVIETKLSNLRLTCQSLMTSVHLKRILGLVLAMGNYMNGGSKRGQADGFGIDILPKLKDVKSKDTSVNLLYYTVQQYIKKYENMDAGTDRVKLPLPDPSDLIQGTQVNFTELEKELKRIQTDFEAAKKRADKVMQNAKEHVHLQPFKETMLAFFEKGEQEYQEQLESLEDGRKVFQETVIFFCVKPKSGDKEVTPDYFFSLWSSFCQDFKDTWKREQQRIIKQRIKENELKVKRMQENLAKKPVRTRTRKAGGLKDRMAKKGLLES